MHGLITKSSVSPLNIFWIINKDNKGISTMVNGTLLKFGKRYEDNLQVIFGQWPKLYLALDALSDQKILRGI